MTISAGKTSSNDDYLEALAAIANQGSTASTGRVYMGQTNQSVGRKAAGQMSEAAQAQVQRRKTDLWMSEEQATSEYYNWSAKQQGDFIAQGILSGLLKLGDGPLEGGKLWAKLVKEASNYGKNGKKVSPIDLMASYVQASGGANAWRQAGVFEINTQTGERRYMGPGQYLGDGRAQMTDTRVDLTDPDTARGVATKLFQDMMGRDPGAGELKSFADALHSAEASNPVVSTTTTQYDLDTGQQLSSDTTQSGGISAEGKAYIGEQQIKKKKEYGVIQAATTLQNTFENLIFGAPE